MKLWIDAHKPAPEGYTWCTHIEDAKDWIMHWEEYGDTIELISVNASDYEHLTTWLNKYKRNYPIRIHSMNPVGVANMRRIIERNGWREIK